MPTNTQPGRRGFLENAIAGLGAIISAALALPAAGYLMLAPRSKTGGDFIEAGDLAKLTVNNPEQLIFQRKRVDGWKVVTEKASAWVVKTSDSKVVAYGPECTHLGCAYKWDAKEKNFACPCHTSAFSLDGKVLMGPAPRSLDRYDVKVEGNKILLGAIRPSTNA
jgi:menaquinol-cytochrome c reductase iron-sulfur subunit